MFMNIFSPSIRIIVYILQIFSEEEEVVLLSTRQKNVNMKRI